MEDGVADRLTDRLSGLPPRTWARLLGAAAAAVAELPTGAVDRDLSALLAGPVSAIAAGPGRDHVVRLLAAEVGLRERIATRLAEAGEEPDVIELLGAVTPGGPPASQPRMSEGREVAVAEVRRADSTSDRDLRAELARLRRQRDGAEARARSAEERAERAEVAMVAAEERARTAESALAEAQDDRLRAVERAERRAAGRERDREADLAGERSGRERAARALERERERSSRLADELALTRRALDAARTAAGTVSPPAIVRRRPVGLPDGVAPDTTEAARHLVAAVDLVIVDGYNLTLRLRPGLDLAAQRQWLLERLRTLAARGPRVVVVFDGDRRDGSRRMDRGVDVRFSPERWIADDDVEFIAGEAAAGGEPTLVVTDDAELRRRVEAHDADVVGVVPFAGSL